MIALNDRIREWCEAHGMVFRPWEIHPSDVNYGPCPFPAGSAGADSWPKAQALRRRIVEDLEREAART